MKFRATKNLTTIWLCALLLNAFSGALFAETPAKSARDLVYCPLTKKLQPVKAAKKEIRPDPLGEICADESVKRSFADAAFARNLLKISSLNEKQFENLVFDFFQKGNAAFAGLPSFPDSPPKDAVKISFAGLNFSQTGELRFALKSTGEDFSFALNPRPPNTPATVLFESQAFHSLAKISRRIAPRAPPFSL